MKQSALKFVNRILLVLLLGVVIGLAGYKITEGGTWASLHQYAGILFAIVGILHLAYSWGWVRANFLKKKKAVAPSHKTGKQQGKKHHK